MESRDAFAKTLADYHFSDPINMFGRRFYWIDEPLYQQVNLLLQPFSGLLSAGFSFEFRKKRLKINQKILCLKNQIVSE